MSSELQRDLIGLVVLAVVTLLVLLTVAATRGPEAEPVREDDPC